MSRSPLRLTRWLHAALACAALQFGAFSQAQTVLRVTTIPEEAATEQVRKFTPLAAYLEQALGMKVEFTPVSDYPAAVEALVNKKVDLVWFGGFTHVQANLRSCGRAQASNCSSVVLPAPEGPITATCSPRARRRRKPCSAGAAPGRAAGWRAAASCRSMSTGFTAARRCGQRFPGPCSSRGWWSRNAWRG
jgi:ABC transporter, phosphonate, periplasmic substrate-binding protein